MYEAFDAFLRVPTWHTRHASDEEQFFLALETVVNNRRFNADALGGYIDQKRERREPAQANLTAEAYATARDHYVHAARAVRTYLRVTGPRP